MTLETISLALQITARVSAVLFLLAFAGEPLASIWPRALPLARRQGTLLLGLAASHTLHLAAIAALAATVGAGKFLSEGGAGLIIGGFIYVAVYTAAFSPTWRGAAFYPIWIGFLGGFLPRASQSAIHAGFCAVLLLALVLRIMVVVRQRRERPQAQAANAAP